MENVEAIHDSVIVGKPFSLTRHVTCGSAHDSEQNLSEVKQKTLIFAPKKPPLPLEVVDRIFDELSILDRCCLALCNKALLRHAQQNEHLEYLVEQPPQTEELSDFFENRLGRGWVDPQLRYCKDCGRFCSTDPVHWRYVTERNTRQRSGRIAEEWRSRREDGWLRYWIERWCDNDRMTGDAAAEVVKREDKTELLCPGCAIHNPDTNAFRRKLSNGKTP